MLEQRVVLGGDGDEVSPIEVVLLAMQVEARFILFFSEASRPPRADCLVGRSAGLVSFLSTLRLPLAYLLLLRLGGLGGLGGILAGGVR